MRIKRFTTTNFRNLRHEPLEFSPGVNLLIGENGHGKTNVLEAIQLFKLGRSFRTTRDNDLIQFDERFCRVELEAEFSGPGSGAGGDSSVFALSIERGGAKKVKVDGDELPKLADLVGRYPCVLFGPHDLALVSGFPAERRKYLDMVGSMTDRDYFKEVRGYKRVLTQRNAALKANDYPSAFGVWAEELLGRGCSLVERRLELVNELRSELQVQMAALGMAYDVDIIYESELTDGRPDEVDCTSHFAARLAAVEREEMRRRTTLAGPHRDDLKLLAGDRDLRRYGSQGQRRLFAILLRLSELSLLEKHLREPCVLLLDDLLSELDSDVSAKLKASLEVERQVFVTSPVDVGWKGARELKVFSVSEGSVAA